MKRFVATEQKWTECLKKETASELAKQAAAEELFRRSSQPQPPTESSHLTSGTRQMIGKRK